MLENLAVTGPVDEGAARRIVVVDDDPVMRAILRGYLENAGYRVTEAEDGERLLDVLPRIAPALMLLDVKLPGTNGFDLLRSIRTRSDLPVIMVTSCSEARKRVEGLELGADDYVTKPFNARELIARVRSVLRRVAERGAAEPLEIGDGWAFDRERRRLVGAEGRHVLLTAAECAIMAALAELPGRPISRDALAMRMGRRLGGPDDRSIDVLVSRIRRKLAGKRGSEPIRSIRNVGYMLDTAASSRSEDQ